MIDLPQHQRTPARTPRARRTRLVGLAAAATLAVATPTAHAGGVAINPGTPTAKAANAPAPADAATTPTNTRRSVGSTQIRRAQTLLRLNATGRHDTQTRAAVKRFQTLRGLNPYGVIDRTTYRQVRDAFALLQTGGITIDTTTANTGGATTTEPTPTFPANLAPITPQEREILDRIAKCESGGNHRIISANGRYRGKYQFDLATWKSVGGTGDPAAATEAEQDQRAAILLRQRGTSPWPTCSRT